MYLSECLLSEVIQQFCIYLGCFQLFLRIYTFCFHPKLLGNTALHQSSLYTMSHSTFLPRGGIYKLRWYNKQTVCTL